LFLFSKLGPDVVLLQAPPGNPLGATQVQNLRYNKLV